MAKIFTYRGKTAEELQKLGLNELAKLLPARQRRNIKRGFTPEQKKLLAKVEAAKAGKYKKPIKTHCRDLTIIPQMFGVKISIHNGKEFVPIDITPEMIGWTLGDFVMTTRFDVKHGGPGIGATRGSKFISVK
jgi:small subunit ribosomal protein S19